MGKDHASMIEDLEQYESVLTDWEAKFVDSISRREYLTDGQAEKLEQIWERINYGD